MVSEYANYFILVNGSSTDRPIRYEGQTVQHISRLLEIVKKLEAQGEKFHPSFITLKNRVKEIQSSSSPKDHELRPLVSFRA